MDKDTKLLLESQANVVAKGLFEFEPGGIRITEKGKNEATERWMNLSPENRLLFGWLIRRELIEGKGGK